MSLNYAEMSNEALMRVMDRARCEAENVMRSNSPIKMILYEMEQKIFTEAHEEYCRRLA